MMTPLSQLRVPVIAGNWKLNKGPGATRVFFRHFKARFLGRGDATIIIFPPAISLGMATDMLRDREDIMLGVQNIHWEQDGAFTGENGGAMAREAGARFALIGHSERRHVFGETDEQVGRKVKAAFEAELTPMICVGETIEERRAEQVEEVVLRQLDAALDPLNADQIRAVAIAYEPVWAIGTGVNATPNDAAEAHAVLRDRLAELAGSEHAARIPILYGGSVKPDNAAELLAAGNVNGLLIGGASLDPTGFARIAAM